MLPVYHFAEGAFEHHVEPDARGAAVALHERVAYVHLYIFFDDMLKGVLWHLLYGRNGCPEIEAVSKPEATLGYILVTDDARKRVQAVKQIMMYLLKAHCRANGNAAYIARFEESVCVCQ